MARSPLHRRGGEPQGRGYVSAGGGRRSSVETTAPGSRRAPASRTIFDRVAPRLGLRLTEDLEPPMDQVDDPVLGDARAGISQAHLVPVVCLEVEVRATPQLAARP